MDVSFQFRNNSVLISSLLLKLWNIYKIYLVLMSTHVNKFI